MARIISLCIIIEIVSAEGLILPPLDISNSFKEYHSTQSYRKSLFNFTTYIHGTIKKKWQKQLLYSRNKNDLCIQEINSKEQTWWKNLVLLTTTNIHHSKNDQKIIWPCCPLMGLHELKIIPCCWNIRHSHGNTK